MSYQFSENEYYLDCDDSFFAEVRGNKYEVGSIDYGYLGSFVEFDDVLCAVRDWAEANDYYPELYFVSDHGNIDDKPTSYVLV